MAIAPIQHKKAYIDSLIIEITRRCNMKCDHCLRGAAQPKDIQLNTLKALLQPVSAIDTMTLSGGEPSLKPDIMMQVLDICKQYSIPVRKLYLVTNGKKVSDAFIDAVYAWHRYTMLSQLPADSSHMVHGDKAYRILHNIVNAEDYDAPGCSVVLSMDGYHEPIPIENILKLACVPHLSEDKYVAENTGDQWVISEGRADTNYLGHDSLQQLRPWLFSPEGSVLNIDDLDADELSIEELFCSATGDILKTCDASYRTQHRLKHFNLSTLYRDETWVDRSAARKAYYDETDKVPPRNLTAYGLIPN